VCLCVVCVCVCLYVSTLCRISYLVTVSFFSQLKMTTIARLCGILFPTMSFCLFEEHIWTPVASMNKTRSNCGVAVLNGILYAVGGYVPDTYVASGESYDPDANSWSDIAPMSMGRVDFGLAALHNKLYAVGGLDKYSEPTASGESYDPVTNVWSNIASMHYARVGVGLASLNGKLYAVGGADGGSCESYDPDINAWINIAPMSMSRGLFGLAALNGKLYAVGGDHAFNNILNFLASGEVYDPSTNSWGDITPMTYGRRDFGLTALNNKLYAVGGVGIYYTYYASGESYDPVTNAWSAIAPMKTNRTSLGLVGLNNSLYAVGGENQHQAFSSVLVCDDPVSVPNTPPSASGGFCLGGETCQCVVGKVINVCVLTIIAGIITFLSTVCICVCYFCPILCCVGVCEKRSIILTDSYKAFYN
jgi:N-acetylneuraminic acid mutarotase